ncbi:MAG: hypothetical protein IJM27_03570 [Eubacterium sp.]|nr:hypothetical protein [Eubacterium sp.]
MTKEEYREYHRRKSREHYQAHKEEYKERARRWGFEYPELKMNDPVYQKEYREKNREWLNRREREANQESRKTAYREKTVWTDEEYAYLRAGVIAGKSYVELAKELGRSVKAVEHAKRRYCPELVTDRMKRHNPYTGEVIEDAGN